MCLLGKKQLTHKMSTSSVPASDVVSLRGEPSRHRTVQAGLGPSYPCTKSTIWDSSALPLNWKVEAIISHTRHL